MKTPEVTVFMPVYNSAEYLEDAVKSILNQTYRDFELLIIDDGSIDKSLEIIKSFDDSRIRLLKNEKNMGVPFTRNRGLKEARGKYIALADSDDISHHERLRYQIDLMKNDDSIILSYTSYVIIDDKNKIIVYPFSNLNDSPASWQLLWDNPVPQPSVMLKKEVFIKNNLFYDERFRVSSDLALWHKAVLFGKFVKVKKHLVFYRMLETSIFHSNQAKGIRNSIESIRLYYHAIMGDEMPEFATKISFFDNKTMTEDNSPDFTMSLKWLSDTLNKFAEKFVFSDNEYKAAKKGTAMRLFIFFLQYRHKDKFKVFAHAISTFNWSILLDIIKGFFYTATKYLTKIYLKNYFSKKKYNFLK